VRSTDSRFGTPEDTNAPVGTPDNPSHRILTVSNLITVSRLVLTLVFLWLFTTGFNRYEALAVYAVAALTDFLDGLVARKTQTVSWFGKVLDPIVDRALLFTGVLGLMIRGELPVWVAVLVIGRDLYLAVGALIVRKYRERPIDVVMIGKVTTALLMFGFCDLLLGLPQMQGMRLVSASWLPLLNDAPSALGILFVYAGCVCSVVTACVYTREGFRIKRETLASRGEGE
jgi:cardiolipin synthase